GCSSLASITIPDSVTSIGDSAFYGCSSLASITIPDSVTSIGNLTLAHCSSLSSITIPDSVTSIESHAFYRCSSLESITIPDSVTRIGSYAFSGCSSLASITIPDGVTGIWEGAFDDCSSLSSITIPDSVTSIGDSAFLSCSSLASITIPDSVTRIGCYAFAICSSLESITIPDSVTSIGDCAFNGCSSLESITVSEENLNYASFEGVLFNKDKTKLIRYPAGITQTEYEIPDSVTSIESHAFYRCSSLESITIPDSVTSIGGSAFSSCSSLASITIPDGVTSIGRYTFGYCRSLSSITIPDSVTSIGDSTFEGCSSLTDVYYTGTEEKWNSIVIESGNSCLTNAEIHFNYTDEPEEPKGERVAKGTLSFPEDAYLTGGSLIADIWIDGQDTNEYLKQEFEISEIKDYPFEFNFSAEETAVSIRVMLRNLSGAQTNLYTDTSSNLQFVLTEEGMKPDRYADDYLSITKLPDMEILIPTGKTVSGKITADDLKTLGNEPITIYFGTYWTRGYVNPETFEYEAVMPYGITEKEYTPYIIFDEGEMGASSNILPGIYYADSEETFTVNPEEDLTDLNFSVNTGYAISGSVTLPDDAVVENYSTNCELLVNGKTYYVTGLTTKDDFSETKKEIPFIIGVEKSDAPVSTKLRLSIRGGMADDMLGNSYYTNILEGNYYYSKKGTTTDEAQADEVLLDSDISGIDFTLKVGCAFNINMIDPDHNYCDFYIISENGELIAEDLIGSVFNSIIVISPEYEGENVYLMYRYDYGHSPLYSGRAYLCLDGSVVGFRKDADKFTIEKANDITFTLVNEDDVDIPETIEYDGKLIESSHPYRSSTTETVRYAYTGSSVKGLWVTMSPLSHIYDRLNATVTITDGTGAKKEYGTDEFNNLLFEDSFYVDGSEFEISLTTPYLWSWHYDYGFAVVHVEPVLQEGNTRFKVADTQTLQPIPNAQIFISNNDGTVSKKATTDSKGDAEFKLDNGIYTVNIIAKDYNMRTFTIEKTDDDAEFTSYLENGSILDIKTEVSEMTYDDIVNAGIDPEAVGNKNVYNCTAVLRFSPEEEITINYICTDDEILIYTPPVDDKIIMPVSKDIYLIIHSNVTWLKEMFDVQLVAANVSAVETIESCQAKLNLPEGLSLAEMIDVPQSDEVSLGNILPQGTAEHHWYICGDSEGEYYISGLVSGIRTGGGISENINVPFKTKEAISVLCGSAMKLTIEAEKTAVTGTPYRVLFRLQNVSNKNLYKVALNILGGKFCKEYSVTDLQYDPEESLGGTIVGTAEEGYVLQADKFKPGDVLSGIFEITFGEGIDTEDGIKYMLTDMFTITGNGSTTEIPTEIKLVDSITKHNWDSGTVTVEATCTTDGEKVYTCTDEGCAETRTEVIPAKGHSMGEWTVREDATCTDDGESFRKCSVCGYEETEIIPATGHDFEDDWTIDKAATCTEAGTESRHCTRCDAATDIREIPAKGHSMGEWTVREDATCTDDGESFRKCSVCGYEETKIIPATGHDFEDDWTVDKAATCTEAGTESRHCTRCDAVTDIREIPAKGHSMSEWTVRTAATCTEKGESFRKCSVCGYEETKTFNALGHDWDDGVITKNPTETEEGTVIYTCKRCGEQKTEIIPKMTKQELEFTIENDITVTYGDFRYVDNMVYNDSENGGEITYTSSNTEVATVDTNGRATILNAGETTITATAAATDRYLETTVSYKIIVNKALLKVKVNDSEIFYGEKPEFKGFEATGFVFEEDSSVILGAPEYTTEYNQFDNVGVYNIFLSGITAKNYNVNTENGILTVKKAEDYLIELGNLTQRKGKVSNVNASIVPKDATAVIKVEYQHATGVWMETIPEEIGEYKVRACLISSDNITVKADTYFEAILNIKPGALIGINGGSIEIDTEIDGNNVEFKIGEADIENILDNVPSAGEIVIDAKGGTEGINNITLPSNLINALDNSTEVDSLTVLADEAEITMSSDVLKTVSDKAQDNDKVSIHIDAVEKDALNEKQQAALATIANDAVILQLNLFVTHVDENGVETSDEIHSLNGTVDVRAAYVMPEDMEGKRIIVCYVADDGSVSYVRANYEDGFVSFKTNHFSHYAIAAIECPHEWDSGIVIKKATTKEEGLKRYTCALCDATKDEIIPKKSSEGSGGGGGGGTAKTTYTVTFDTNGGSVINSVEVEKNNIVTKPKDPTKEGFIFDGWYSDKNLVTAYDFNTNVTKAITLYAKWAKQETENDKAWKNPFTDVTENDWFYGSVKYSAENGLFSGTSDTTFEPNGLVTRAMLVTVLWRAEGKPQVNYAMSFDDIDTNSYYIEAVRWAASQGIVNGRSETEFAPDDSITREQIAAIMYRYARYKGYDVSVGEDTNVLSYTDAEKISEYAITSVQYAVGAGMMNGKTNTTINPQDNATRAEVATILKRFLEANK
ncbi:MAG: leucine-rich repeat protein, partial [Clostridia bacterium]